jgi:hypothetical protein
MNHCTFLGMLGDASIVPYAAWVATQYSFSRSISLLQSQSSLPPKPDALLANASKRSSRQPTSRPSAKRHRSARIIQRIWLRFRMLSRLHDIYRTACATKIQATFRSFLCRKRSAPLVARKLQELLVEKFASARVVSLTAVPPKYVPNVAARRIQLAVRRFLARRKRELQRRVFHANRIKRVYSRFRFKKFLENCDRRRAEKQRRDTAARRLQAAMRGYLIRGRIRTKRSQLASDRANAFPVLQRNGRILMNHSQFKKEEETIRNAQASLLQHNVLQSVLALESPNKEIVKRIVEESIVEGPLKGVNHAPRGRPIDLVPMAAGACQAFVPEAQALKPTLSLQYAERYALHQNKPAFTLRSIREEARRVAEVSHMKHVEAVRSNPRPHGRTPL